MLKKLDLYIIRKFLGTFFYAIALIISIAIIFDFSEKIDDFMENEASFRLVFFDYYLNFIPYFTNLFSGLFTFIAVIYFTSKLAYDSEIIAVLSSGVTFGRLVRPYMISAFIIALMSWVLGDFIIPPANQTRIDFEKTYIKSYKVDESRNIHLQLEPNFYIYINRYNAKSDVGHRFTIEKFDENNKLISKLKSDYIKWDRERNIWVINNYTIRDIVDDQEILRSGKKLDTLLNMQPSDFAFDGNIVATLDYFQLRKHIKEQRLRGVSNVIVYEIEKHNRTAIPFSVFILTIIGVSLASRKIRGGLGLHLMLGLLLSFSFIMFQQMSKVFALSGSTSAFMAAWIPNIIYAVIAFYLYLRASK